MSGLNDHTPAQMSYDLLAEQSLLKIAMGGDPHALQLCGDLITAFWSGLHRTLAAVLSGMFRRGEYVDAVSVLGQITAQGLISKIDGPFLHSIMSGPGEHSGVLWYAERLREMAARRNLTEASHRLIQRMEWGWANGEDVDATSALAEFRVACDAIEATLVNLIAQGGPQSLAEFLDGPTEEDWLVPGLLERGERIILTGGEGLGKSVLCSQIGAAMAGSVHPFSGAVLGEGNRGIRVTVVDAENSGVQSRRRYRRIIHQVDRIRRGRDLPPVDWKAQAAIDLRPEGMDLLKTRDVARLEHVVAATAPDLLILGPLYKIFGADPSDEQAVREVSSVLDGLRARHHFALLLEAHPGKGEGPDGARRMAPIGSSLWMRWPEYGFGIRRAKGAKRNRAELVDVVSWRGSREERQWPERLRHDTQLPWAPAAIPQGDEPVEDEPTALDPDWYR